MSGGHTGRSVPLKVGAVGYLNARPLTWSLDRDRGLFDVRYDVPSVCGALLHSGAVDLGLIPSIEYLERPDYRFVPGVAVSSFGPVASVALFTRRPLHEVRRVALDTSSRTSVALLKVLCAHRFRIAPEFVPSMPDLARMLTSCDAALVIGDPALEIDPDVHGAAKVDLGAEWSSMTGLPFVYAAWTGRAEAIDAAHVAALQEAQRAGTAAVEAIAAEYAQGNPARERRAADYLRDNVRYALGPDETRGLQLFLDYSADLGLAPHRRPIEFY